MDKYLFNGNLLPLCPCGTSETLWALHVGKILSFFPFCLFYWSQWEKKKTQSNTSQPRPELTRVTPLSADSLRFCRSVEPVLGGSVALSCPRGRPHHREVDRCLQKDVVWTFQYNSASLFPVDKKKKRGTSDVLIKPSRGERCCERHLFFLLLSYIRLPPFEHTCAWYVFKKRVSHFFLFVDICFEKETER